MSSSSDKNRSPVHEHKIPSKFLTREETTSQLSNPNSFRVYYGKCAAGSVPFNWESQPGTPKHPSTTTKLDPHAFPPLTPPPSYFYYPSSESMIKKKPTTKSHNLLHIILPKLTLIIRRPNLMSMYRSNYSSSSSCSSSEPSSPAVARESRRAVTAKISTTPKTHDFSSSSKEEGVHSLMPCFGPRR